MTSRGANTEIVKKSGRAFNQKPGLKIYLLWPSTMAQHRMLKRGKKIVASKKLTTMLVREAGLEPARPE